MLMAARGTRKVVLEPPGCEKKHLSCSGYTVEYKQYPVFFVF